MSREEYNARRRMERAITRSLDRAAIELMEADIRAAHQWMELMERDRKGKRIRIHRGKPA